MPKRKTAKIVLGIVGEIAAGKDTAAAYLKKKYKSQTVSFSQPLRDILDRLYLPQTRANMANLGISLRGTFGQDLLSKVIYEEVTRSPAKILVLPNVRLESDLIYLKHLPGFRLIRIDCDIKTCFVRLKKRRQNNDDRTKTWKQFINDLKLPTETPIRLLAKKAKLKLDNNGTKQELFKQIDELMKNIKK
ncbi:MAG: AAA family ATPase [Candidatus Buchananbacteria bacterium]